MSGKEKFSNRSIVYVGGLLLGLAAGIGFYQLKKAMMPRFHETEDARAEIVIAPGGSVRFVYGEDPGYFLIPGLPTNALISRKNQDGTFTALFRAQYGALVEKEPVMGPITEEGTYFLDADFYICAEPGVADCAKLNLTQNIRVERNASAGESRIELDLRQLAGEALKTGNLLHEDARNKVEEKSVEEAKP